MKPTSTAPRKTPNGSGGRRIRGLDATERLEQRRNDLLDAALELFAANGYANTSIEQICQTAYVSTKSFYELFTGKEACFMALYERIIGDVAKRVGELLEQTLPSVDRAHALLAAAIHAMVDDPRVARIAFVEWQGMSRLLDEEKIEASNWGAVFIADELRRTGADIDPAIDVNRLALGITGGFSEYVIRWIRTPEPRDVDALIADMTAFYDVIRRGLTSG